MRRLFQLCSRLCLLSIARLCSLLLLALVPPFGLPGALAQTGQGSAITGDTADPEGTRRTIGPSGFQVPRFVSLARDKVHMRRGPSTDHPIEWVYRGFSGLPVQVVAETEVWRKVLDHEGVTGWIHRSMLEGQRRARVVEGGHFLHSAPGVDAKVLASVTEGALGEIEVCGRGWCRLRFGRTTGWMDRSALWGVMPGERIEAP